MSLLALLLQVADPGRGPSFAELLGGAAVVAAVSLLAWGALSINALNRRFDTFAQVLFGPQEAKEPSGVLRDLEKLKTRTHDNVDHVHGIALYLGVELEENGKVRAPDKDSDPPIERRLWQRRESDRHRPA